MYRILRATNNYYYVQKKADWNWKKVGGFFYTIRSAENFISDLKLSRPSTRNRVVGYY